MLRKSRSLLGRVFVEERSSGVGMIPPLVVPRILTFLVALSLLQGCMSSPRRPVVEKPGHKTRGVYHTVKRHQTLWRISKTYNVDMYRVARINGIKNVSEIKAGQKIFIPGVSISKTWGHQGERVQKSTWPRPRGVSCGQ
jgi:hypothetical protein